MLNDRPSFWYQSQRPRPRLPKIFERLHNGTPSTTLALRLTHNKKQLARRRRWALRLPCCQAKDITKDEKGRRSSALYIQCTPANTQVPCTGTQCKLDCDPLLYTPLTLRALEMPKKGHRIKNGTAGTGCQRQEEGGVGQKKVQSEGDSERGKKMKLLNKRR